jgi:hypothetical protein
VSTARTSNAATRLRERPASALLGVAAVWAVQLVLVWLIGEFWCDRIAVARHVVNLAALAGGGGLTFLAERARRDAPDVHPASQDTVAFLGLTSVLMSAIFLIAIIATAAFSTFFRC